MLHRLGPNSCTYLLEDGTGIDSSIVPVGDPIYPEDNKNADAVMIDVETFQMPAASYFPSLCIRRLGDQIELSSGRPKVLTWIKHVPAEGPGSELRTLFDENGKFVCPETYRGVRTTGYDDHGSDWTIFGPVQPDNVMRKIVMPWPRAIYETCSEMAGCELDSELMASIWQCVERLLTD